MGVSRAPSGSTTAATLALAYVRAKSRSSKKALERLGDMAAPLGCVSWVV